MERSREGQASSNHVMQAGRWRYLAPSPIYPIPPGPVPTFSVIIPAYEASAFVGEAVRSALAQTVPPLEVIVCDDGSTDDLERSLPSSDRIVLVRQEHRGVASARNTAVDAASGDFVAILDADDVYLPERLEALGALAVARPDLDIITTDAFIEADDVVRGRFNDATPFAVENQREAILERCFCPWPAIRRSRVLAIGGFDESLVTGSDWECLIRLILLGCSVGLVDEPLYRYRLRAASLTSERIRALRGRTLFLEKTAARPGLRPEELRVLARSLARQQRSLVLAEAERSLRQRRPDARRRALRVASTSGLRLAPRLTALLAAAFPGRAAAMLERRARTTGRSLLERPMARTRSEDR
jgi:glycosyltransferase involved in cell wall biosynthesis